MTLDLPTKSWRLWSRGHDYKLEVSWPNSLASPIVVEGNSLDQMCAEVRAIWLGGLSKIDLTREFGWKCPSCATSALS